MKQIEENFNKRVESQVWNLWNRIYELIGSRWSPDDLSIKDDLIVIKLEDLQKIRDALVQKNEEKPSKYIKMEDKDIESYHMHKHIIYLIEKERKNQIRRFGKQFHPKPLWLGILTEELGEVAKEVNEFTFSEILGKNKDETRVKLKKELIQVIAVGISWLEQIYSLK